MEIRKKYLDNLYNILKKEKTVAELVAGKKEKARTKMRLAIKILEKEGRVRIERKIKEGKFEIFIKAI